MNVIEVDGDTVTFTRPIDADQEGLALFVKDLMQMEDTPMFIKRVVTDDKQPGRVSFVFHKEKFARLFALTLAADWSKP